MWFDVILHWLEVVVAPNCARSLELLITTLRLILSLHRNLQTMNRMLSARRAPRVLSRQKIIDTNFNACIWSYVTAWDDKDNV